MSAIEWSEIEDAESLIGSCLDGKFGTDARFAAESAVTCATEHGYIDDVVRVAETLQSFLPEGDRTAGLGGGAR